MWVFVTLPTEIDTFLRTNGDSPNWLLIFSWENTHSENKSCESSRTSTNKVTTTTACPGNHPRFCVWIQKTWQIFGYYVFLHFPSFFICLHFFLHLLVFLCPFFFLFFIFSSSHYYFSFFHVFPFSFFMFFFFCFSFFIISIIIFSLFHFFIFQFFHFSFSFFLFLFLCQVLKIWIFLASIVPRFLKTFLIKQINVWSRLRWVTPFEASFPFFLFFFVMFFIFSLSQFLVFFKKMCFFFFLPFSFLQMFVWHPLVRCMACLSDTPCGLGWTSSRNSRSLQREDPWLQSRLGRAPHQLRVYLLVSPKSLQVLCKIFRWVLKTHWVFQFFTDFENASECIRSHGPDSCCIMGVRGKVADRLSQANLPFTALELVRSDHGIWAHEHNAALLPLGSFPVLHGYIIRPVDAGNPWTWKGRTMSSSVLVRFDVAEEGNDTGFCASNSQVHDGSEDLGELLLASPSLDQHAEVVLETTVDDAHRVRQILGVNHISQRKVGPHGRVRITVGMPESVISWSNIAQLYLVSFIATCHCGVASLPVCGAMGRVVFFAYQRSMDFWTCLVWVTEMGSCRHFHRLALRWRDLSVERMACRWFGFKRHFISELAGPAFYDWNM